MSQLITASIDLLKIDKSRLIQGKKGTYLNLVIWVNDKPDKFDNDVSIEQRTEQGDNKIYLGNGRTYKREKVPDKPDDNGIDTLLPDLPF